MRAVGSSDDSAILTLLICAPFGEYELELGTNSFSDGTSGTQQHTSWEILNGLDEVTMHNLVGITV